MNYVYVLEGQLKYEKIEYESHLTFELYNKNRKAENYESEVIEDLVYYLQSDIDISISLDMNKRKIYISTSSDVAVLLSDHDGITKESETTNQIDITKKLVGVSIPAAGFSFLLNSSDLLDAPVHNENVNHLDFKKILHDRKKKIKYIIPLILIFIAAFFYFSRSEGESNKLVFFNNQSDLMRANLYSLNSNDVFVKTELNNKVEILLDEIGIKYVRFELVERNSKINLLLYVFEKNNDDLEKSLTLSNVSWLSDVIFKALDPKHMYEDFNIIAEKYNLNKLDIFNRSLIYELVTINLTNNNLKYASIQRDTKVFRERWGKNYIEFNINLVKKKKETYDFIILNGSEKIIKSGQGYYLN